MVLPGLYIGNIRDSKDFRQLDDNDITHILSIHDNAKKMHTGKKYLCITVSDSPSTDLTPYFSECNDFIHDARINGGNVLVHCLAGVSRSVTVSVAYMMTVTDLGWRETLNAVKGARKCASPNFGFQRQLQAFEFRGLKEEKKRLKEKHPPMPKRFNDEEFCLKLLEAHQRFVLYGDVDPDESVYPLAHNAYKNSASSDQNCNKNTNNGVLVQSPSQEDIKHKKCRSSSKTEDDDDEDDA
ncbi:dual specificity protein phosphatase 22-like isoform X2 [Lineus longissimus]|uniref:dual specificity protein phosphatase 22-like isoform X2 n=1 Tax=Lineus longissimus TaxID=88925 RepID=UPI00315CF467